MKKPYLGMTGALLSCGLLLAACSGGSAAPADAAAMLDGPDCRAAMTQKWNRLAEVGQGTVTSTTEGGGALTMSASSLPKSICQPPLPACPDGVIELTQGGVADDDLEATATFEAFAAGGPGSAAGLRMDLITGQVAAFIRQSDSPVLEIFVTGMPMASMPTTAASGTFRVVRRAGVVTVTASGGGSSVEVVAPIPASREQILAMIGIYNRGDSVIDGETSIRFSDFQMSGSTAIESDTFDCN